MLLNSTVFSLRHTVTFNMRLYFLEHPVFVYTYIFFLSEREHKPRRLVEGNGANVQLLYFIDGPDGQGAVVGQSQTVGAEIIPEHH